MTDTQYDKFLSQLRDKCENAGWSTNGSKFLEYCDLPISLGNIQRLEELHYIETHGSGTPQWTITITQEGIDFINRGGFTKKTYLENEPLKVSKKANSIAILAIIFAILAILISILVWQFPK